MIEVVIFDLDGVIVSTDELHYQAWKEMANIKNIYFDRLINNRLRGVSRLDSLNIILENATRSYSLAEKEQLMNLKNEIYLKSLSTITQADCLPGVKEVLAYLREKKYKVAIGSSSKNAFTILKQIGLVNEFDFISDGNMIKRSKPFGDVFTNVSTYFNISPSKCIVIEDAKAGIDAARAANMISVGIGDAYGYQKADYSIKQITDLISILHEIK